MKGKFVSYLRVSTAKQGTSGLGLEAQRKAVTDYLDGGRWTLIAEFVEVETGKRGDRPKLAQALALCRLQKATLIVAKIDRLARNLHFLTGLMESGVHFAACDMPQANELTIHILAAVAQAEAKAISERTKVALAAAKARGVPLGGNRGKLTDATRSVARQRSTEVRRQAAQQRNADLLPIIQAIRANGASSLRQIAAELNRLGHTAPRGGQWQAAQVMQILNTTNAA